MKNIIISALFISLISCGKEYRFVLHPSSSSGVEFNNQVIESDSLNILSYEYMYNGGGVAIGDFNNDGKEDLYFTGNIVDNALYLNQGKFQFKDVSIASNTSCSGSWCMGASTIDINQDGWMDIYISVTGKTESNNLKNILLINKGLNSDGIPQFENQAKAYGLDSDAFSINAYFFDYNNDGLLDVYIINNRFANRGEVLNNRKSAKNLITKNINQLYRNIDGKSFEDVTETAGVLNDGFSLSASILDVNKDGWSDIFVSNDFSSSSVLYVNRKDGTFIEDTGQYIQHQSFSSMGVDVADFDNNGDEDLISLDMLPRTLKRTKQMFSKTNFLFYDLLDHYNEEPQYMRNCLYVASNNNYNEISQLAGVHNTDWSWSPIFADFDNDGRKDLSITNGFPRDLTDLDFINYRNSYSSILATTHDYLDHIPSVKLSNNVFQNNGNYEFDERTSDWGLNRPSYSHGQATVDLDQDGDLDLVINNLNDIAYVYENKSNSKNNFISVNLKGPLGNINALHAKITIYYGDGKMQFLRQNPYRGYLSSLSRQLHFGLGNHSIIDSLKIDWNNGQVSIINDITSNSFYTYDYQSIQHYPKKESLKRTPLFFNSNDLLNLDFVHRENESYDFFQYELQHRVFTNEGPPIGVGDVNNDGLEDIILGGAKGQETILYIQNTSMQFEAVSFKEIGKKQEVTALALFDLDNDNDMDLYLGYGHDGSNDSLQRKDQIVLNDGKGNFSLSESLPDTFEVTSKIISHDFDQDGDIDLFIASRLKPEQYPLSPQSFYFENMNGIMVNKTKEKLPLNGFLGRIADAELMDVNGDNRLDIIFTGNWMGIDAIIFGEVKAILRSNILGESLNGLWNSIEVNDLDNDGDMDIIVGNHGWNTPYHASEQHPLKMVYADLNGNGRPDPIIFNYQNKDYFPIHLRDNFLNQLQHKKKQFNTYALYASAAFDQIFSEDEKQQLLTDNVHTFSTLIFENLGETYKKHTLPVSVQFSPSFDSKVITLNKKKYILFVGNDNMFEVFTGPKNAYQGELIEIRKDFSFKRIPPFISGISIPGAAKHIKSIEVGKNNILLVTQNNDKLLSYSINKTQFK